MALFSKAMRNGFGTEKHRAPSMHTGIPQAKKSL
jgi:hypothetical protein